MQMCLTTLLRKQALNHAFPTVPLINILSFTLLFSLATNLKCTQGLIWKKLECVDKQQLYKFL